jgi:hypothetical protein
MKRALSVSSAPPAQRIKTEDADDEQVRGTADVKIDA